MENSTLTVAVVEAGGSHELEHGSPNGHALVGIVVIHCGSSLQLFKRSWAAECQTREAGGVYWNVITAPQAALDGQSFFVRSREYARSGSYGDWASCLRLMKSYMSQLGAERHVLSKRHNGLLPSLGERLLHTRCAYRRRRRPGSVSADRC